MNDTLEQSLLKEFSGNVKRLEDTTLKTLAYGAFENEAQARELVGYLRACRELKDLFENLVKAYFPTT